MHCTAVIPHSGSIAYLTRKTFFVVIPLTHHKNGGFTELKVVGVWALNYPFVYSIFIAIRLKIQTKSSHKTHKSQLLRLDFVNLNSWIAIAGVLKG